MQRYGAAFFILTNAMAYTLNQSPPSWIAGSKHPIIFVVKDTDFGNPKYKYICDIYVEGTKVARLKCLPNSAGAGVFNITRVVDDHLEHQVVDINTSTAGINEDLLMNLGANDAAKPFSKNLDSIHKVEVKFGHEEADDATSAPAITEDEITGNYITVIKSHLPDGLTFGSYMGKGVNASESTFERFEMSATIDEFISAVPVISKNASINSDTQIVEQDIERGQVHLLSFTNDMTTSGASKGVSFIHVAGYEADGTEIFNDSIQNTGANGGEPPTSSNSDDERLLFFGSGHKNLGAQSVTAAINTGMDDADLSYYEVVAASSATLSGLTQTSRVYRFNIKEACKFETRRVMFINRFGGWDFFNFTKVSRKTISYDRKTYHRVRGNWDAADGSSTDWHFTAADRGKVTLYTSATQQEVLNSDFVSEDFNDFFEQLFASPEVYIIEQKSGADLHAVPVNITNSQSVRKTGINEKLISYDVTVEYSNHQAVG